MVVLGTTAFGTKAHSGVKLVDTSILRGRGMVVALGGHKGRGAVAGRMRTVETFAFEAGRRYRLEFQVAGSHLGGPHAALDRSLEARIPGVGANRKVQLPSRAGFRPVRLEFTPTKTATSPIEFVSCGAPGHGGLLLDSVHLTEAA